MFEMFNFTRQHLKPRTLNTIYPWLCHGFSVGIKDFNILQYCVWRAKEFCVFVAALRKWRNCERFIHEADKKFTHQTPTLCHIITRLIFQLNYKSFETWSCWHLTKLENKVAIFVALAFGLNFGSFPGCVKCFKLGQQRIKTWISHETSARLQDGKRCVGVFCAVKYMNQLACWTKIRNRLIRLAVDTPRPRLRRTKELGTLK